MFSFDVASEYMGDDARVVTYDREELHAWEKKQFYNDGIEQGIEQERKVIVKNMLDSKMTISKISNLLKIPKEEIKQLIES